MADAPPFPDPATAPADLVPVPRRHERLLWYVGTMLLALALVAAGMRVWARDLGAPFYYDLDALLYLPLVKTVIERGTHWETERLGAPGRQELYDFPIIDHLHFALLWLIGRVFPDPLHAYNAYSLLAYPLTALTAMWVLRWLGLTLPGAALGGFLYAFLPYHQERYHYHYFLALYFWVPVSLVPALALMRGRFPYYPANPDGTRRRRLFSWVGAGTALAGVVTASAGAYYAFFACACYAFAGAYGWALYRTWRALASAALVIGPVVATGVAYHLPTFVYHLRHGANVLTEREAQEADLYGLKLAHVLLPAHDHNFAPFADLRTRYAVPERVAEGESAGSFGLVGACGLLGLIAVALLPGGRRWPFDALAALALFLVLLATIGALGTLFNLLVTPQIRAYNRACVFLAVPALAAALWWLDRFTLTRTGARARKLRLPVLAAVLVLGYLDQTPWGWNPLNADGMAPIDRFAARFRADKDFFARAEAALPPGTRVFCLPHTPFPESPPLHKMGNYEHGRGYLMTDTLYWSYGAIKRRETDAWHRDVALGKPDELLPRIVAAGFDALLIDGRGFPAAREDRAGALIARLNQLYQQLARAAGVLPMVVHADGRQFVLDLRPYREAYQRVDPPGYAERARREREWVAPLWLGRFHLVDPGEDGERYVWGTRDGTLTLVNPTDRPRAFEMSFRIGIDSPGAFRFALTGALDADFTLERPNPGATDGDDRRHGENKTFALTVPPGRSTVRFRVQVPDDFEGDSGGLCFFIQNFKLVEK